MWRDRSSTGLGSGARNWRRLMKTYHLSAMLLATGLAMGAVVAGCEEKKSEPAKTISDAAAKTGEVVKDAAAKTGEAVKDAAAKTGEAAKDATKALSDKAKELAPPPAPAPAGPDMTALAMEKIDAGMKSARSTLDELKRKADAANPLVKTAATTILTEAEAKYSALVTQVKALTGTDGAARERAIGDVTAGLDKLNELLASAKSKLGM